MPASGSQTTPSNVRNGTANTLAQQFNRETAGVCRSGWRPAPVGRPGTANHDSAGARPGATTEPKTRPEWTSTTG